MTYLAHQLEISEFDDVMKTIDDIEISFNIKLRQRDLVLCNSIQELAEIIYLKMNLDISDTSTKEIALKKFSKAYHESQNTTVNIQPDTSLKTLFSQQNRGKIIEEMESKLGVRLRFLSIPSWNMYYLGYIFLLFPLIFLLPTIILIIISIIIIVTIINVKFFKTFHLHSVDNLINQIIRENYCKIRNSNSYNPEEVIAIIIEIACINLRLDKSKFDRFSKFRIAQ